MDALAAASMRYDLMFSKAMEKKKPNVEIEAKNLPSYFTKFMNSLPTKGRVKKTPQKVKEVMYSDLERNALCPYWMKQFPFITFTKTHMIFGRDAFHFPSTWKTAPAKKGGVFGLKNRVLNALGKPSSETRRLEELPGHHLVKINERKIASIEARNKRYDAVLERM